MANVQCRWFGTKLPQMFCFTRYERMTSTDFSPESVKKSLDRDGFFDLQDCEAGQRLLKCNILYLILLIFLQRINPVVKGFVFGHSMPYRMKPGRIFCFLPGGERTDLTEAEQPIYPLMVHIWAKRSRVKYWKDSHKHSLPVLEDKGEVKEPLHELARSSLVEAGCKPIEREFDSGTL
ncbi:hypothetical protein IF2G_10876 [Cordyceps javanica]|nr:hypothetical protein IF2G_10876 [Cordyceps javanica]